MWTEVETAKNENKRELNLIGATISEKIEQDGLDKNIFDLTSLNLLHISDTVLSTIPKEISNLTNLQNLIVYKNKIANLPEDIGQLVKLKILDLSFNSLKVLPIQLNDLVNLTTINLSNNQLESFPILTKTTKLSVLDLSGNQLIEFPNIFHENFANLSDINLKCNKIEIIPDSIADKQSLKVLNLSGNKIKAVPKVLASLSKLKELDLKENPIADKRLLKLINQCGTKQILDYVKQHGTAPVIVATNATTEKKASGKGKDQKKVTDPAYQHKITVEKYEDESIHIIYAPEVRSVRPFIVCCVIKNMIMDANNFKKFIQLQTKLHETVCDKRELCTIATHDLAKIKGNAIHYTIRPAKRLEIIPLGRTAKVTGQKLFEDLKSEADALRKEKKRNVYTGIYKYLYLLENKEDFACLIDNEQNTISLPPLTNSDNTKMSMETKNILIEITSTSSLPACKKAMETLIHEMILNGICTETTIKSENADKEITINELTLQQVKVIEWDGTLKNVYPSKVDLQFDDKIVVQRV